MVKNFRKHKILVVEWHCMCKRVGKMLYICFFSVMLLESSGLPCLFGVQQIMPRYVVDLLACQKDSLVRKADLESNSCLMGYN